MGKSLYSMFKIDIQGLDFKEYEYDFPIEKGFFSSFENSPITNGVGNCRVLLLKSETMIRADFDIQCQIDLVCDRSLREFQFPLKVAKSVIFKYGAEWKELDDELYEIPSGLDKLNLASFIYEFTILGLPMKRLHPEYSEENETDSWVYSTENEKEQNDEQAIDPRWENLKELRK